MGEILQFGKKLDFVNFFMVNIVFGKTLNLLCQKYATGQIFSAVKGQILKKLSSHLVTLVVGGTSLRINFGVPDLFWLQSQLKGNHFGRKKNVSMPQPIAVMAEFYLLDTMVA